MKSSEDDSLLHSKDGWSSSDRPRSSRGKDRMRAFTPDLPVITRILTQEAAHGILRPSQRSNPKENDACRSKCATNSAAPPTARRSMTETHGRNAEVPIMSMPSTKRLLMTTVTFFAARTRA
jgi:hypothetical protein